MIEMTGRRVRLASIGNQKSTIGKPAHSLLALPSAGRVGRRPDCRCPEVWDGGMTVVSVVPRRLNPLAGRSSPVVPSRFGAPRFGSDPASVGRLAEDTA